MILVVHILLAIASILYSIFTVFNPSSTKVKNIYILTSGTLLSGAVLIVTTPASFEKFCISGLLYIGIIALCIIFGKRSLLLSR